MRFKPVVKARDVAAVIFVTLASSAFATGALELWRAQLGVPFLYRSDSLPHALAIKQVVDNGWFFHDPRLGAPFGQHFQDWPLPDTLHLVVAKLLGLFSDNWAAIVNVMYLASYPLVAVSAWWVLKRMGVTSRTAAVLAVLYSLLPYHVVRGENHLFLAMYYTVPLGVLLAWRVMTAEPLFPRNERLAQRSPLLARLSGRSLGTVAICVLVGSSGAYYTAFTVIFVAVAAVGCLVTMKNWRVLLPALSVVILLTGTLLVNAAPAILYAADHGPNIQGPDRHPSDSERYGLKLASMVLPVPEHRIPSLADLSEAYYEGTPLQSEGAAPALGVIALIGLVMLLAVALFSPLTREHTNDLDERRLAVLAVTGFLVGTVGGISALISVQGITMIRSWNRISIFIAFLALTVFGLALDRVLARRRGAGVDLRNRSVGWGILAIVLVIGVLDQTSRMWVPKYEQVTPAFLNDQKYFSAIEAAMPAGSMIFQAPRQAFPEGAGGPNVGAYEHLQPYMHTSSLRWSFGGIKGRLESEWQDRLRFDSPQELLPQIVAVGFEGLYIDRRYLGDQWRPFEDEVFTETGIPPVVDAPEQKAFYDLRPYVQRMRNENPGLLADTREALLSPVFAETATEFHDPETDGIVTWQWADGPDAILRVYNAGNVARNARISFGLQTATGNSANFRLRWPDGEEQSVVAAAEPAQINRALSFAKGWSEISIETDAVRHPTDDRELHFRVNDLVVSPL